MKKNNIAAWKTYLNKHLNKTDHCKMRFVLPSTGITGFDIENLDNHVPVEDCIVEILGECNVKIISISSTGEFLIAISSHNCRVLLKNNYNNDIKNIEYDHINNNNIIKNTLKRHIDTYANPPKWFDYPSIEWLNALLTGMQQSDAHFEVKINEVNTLRRLFHFCVNIYVTLNVSISKLKVTPIQTLNINSSGNIPAVPITKYNCNSVNLSGRIINFPDSEPIELNHDRLAGILSDMAKRVNPK